jgi:pSer/pThr/pTyr-binding forkhead associated (FHA) protein
LAAATLAGATVLLLLCGVGLYLLKRSSGNVPTLVATSVPTELVDDKNGSVRDSTVVSARRTQLGPKARVLINPDREIDLSRTAATSIGRDASNAVVLDDKQVSRHHARITYDRGDFWIEDLHSTNGTRVNGEPIGQQKLANYDRIELGDVILTFTVETN